VQLLKHLRLLQKFGLVGGVCALLLGSSLVVSVYGIVKMSQGFSTFADRDQAIALALKDMYAQGLQAEQATRNILLNPADEKAKQNYARAMEEFDKAHGVVTAKYADLPEVKSEITSATEIWKDAVVLQQEVQKLAEEGKKEEALELLVKTETPKWREVRAKLIKLGDDRFKKMNGAKAEMTALSHKALVLSIALGAAAILSAVVLMAILVLGMIGSIRKMSEMMQTVTSSWDLTNRLEVTSADELGKLAADFNLMTERLSEMVAQVHNSGNKLNRISRDIHQVSRQVVDAVELQSAGVNNTSTAMVQIISSINEVANGVTILSTSASESASSILEMAACVEEVAENSDSLAGSVEEVSASITEMAAAVRQISQSAGNLLEASSTTASSMMEMDATNKEVKRSALESVAISQQVQQDAETGREAMEATMAGIQEIKVASSITADVIANLSQRGRDIGTILSVIDGLAQQTNLLSLNAAIIAAQAGEHGKGFAVVAEEIKGLADRTSSSTREIDLVVKGVQEETLRAVEAIDRAERSIKQGETLSLKSQEALSKIVTGVEQVTVQAGMIASATAEQASGSHLIREAMEQVSDMVRQIANATRDQNTESDLIMAAVSRMTGITSQVKTSTREQSNAAGQISQSTEDITGMIETIKRACHEQRQGGDQIGPAVENIRISTGSNLDAVKILDGAFRDLAAEIQVLRDEIGRFQVGEVKSA
jgi:methyl-accepting chemotaxis protein